MGAIHQHLNLCWMLCDRKKRCRRKEREKKDRYNEWGFFPPLCKRSLSLSFNLAALQQSRLLIEVTMTILSYSSFSFSLSLSLSLSFPYSHSFPELLALLNDTFPLSPFHVIAERTKEPTDFYCPQSHLSPFFPPGYFVILSVFFSLCLPKLPLAKKIIEAAHTKILHYLAVRFCKKKTAIEALNSESNIALPTVHIDTVDLSLGVTKEGHNQVRYWEQSFSPLTAAFAHIFIFLIDRHLFMREKERERTLCLLSGKVSIGLADKRQVPYKHEGANSAPALIYALSLSLTHIRFDISFLVLETWYHISLALAVCARSLPPSP